MRLGLALSGGGLRGIAHIGVLKGLKEYNLHPSYISGSSAGAVIAALYAYGYSPAEMENMAMNLNGEYIDPDYIRLVKSLFQFLMGRELSADGIIKGKQIEKTMDDMFEGCYINNVSIPLAITSVNVNNGQTIIFVSSKRGLTDKGNIQYMDNIKLSEAVRASISIPVIFKPKIFSNMRLVDGGVGDNLPVGVLKEMGAQRVIAVNLGYSGQLKNEVDNMFEIGFQTIDIMAYNITRYKSFGADCILNPNIYNVGLKDLDKIPECIERGYQCVNQNIKLIKKAVKI